MDVQTQAKIEKFTEGFEERRERKLDRVRGYAENAARRSEDASKRSNAAVEGIPMGQPILVGHHSEKKHRRALDRSWRALGKSVEEGRKAEKWERVAESIDKDHAIHYDDPEAAEKITARIAQLEVNQVSMKAVNAAYKAYLKKPESLDARDISDALKAAVRNYRPDAIHNRPFPSYSLSNNSANIRRLKKRLAGLSQQLESAVNGRWLPWLKRDGNCCACAKALPQGQTRAFWVRAERALYCEDCAPA